MTSFPRPPSDLLLGNSPRSPRSRRGVVLYFFVNPVNPDSSLSWGSRAKRSIKPWKVFSTGTLNRFIKMVCPFSLFQIYSIFSQIYILILQFMKMSVMTHLIWCIFSFHQRAIIMNTPSFRFSLNILTLQRQFCK